MSNEDLSMRPKSLSQAFDRAKTRGARLLASISKVQQIPTQLGKQQLAMCQQSWQKRVDRDADCRKTADRLTKDLIERVGKVFAKTCYPVDRFVKEYINNLDSYVDIYDDTSADNKKYKEVRKKLGNILIRRLARELCFGEKEKFEVKEQARDLFSLDQSRDSVTNQATSKRIISFSITDKDFSLKQRSVETFAATDQPGTFKGKLISQTFRNFYKRKESTEARTMTHSVTTHELPLLPAAPKKNEFALETRESSMGRSAPVQKQPSDTTKQITRDKPRIKLRNPLLLKQPKFPPRSKLPGQNPSQSVVNIIDCWKRDQESISFDDLCD